MKKIIELNQLMSTNDRDKKENFKDSERLDRLIRPKDSDPEFLKLSPSNKKEKHKDPTPSGLSFKFLDLLQTEKNVMGGMPIQTSGTLTDTRLLKDRERKIKSTFKIEFKTAGVAEVMVYQTKDEYEVVVSFENSAKIGSNPILFKNLIEKQLQEKLGVNLKIKVC